MSTKIIEYIRNYVIDNFNSKFFELKESSCGGLGVFAKDYIIEGTIFEEKVLLKLNPSIDDGIYTWIKGLVIDGLGLLSNGSCPRFNEFKVGSNIGPYKVMKYNMICNHPFLKNKVASFISNQDIKPGEEIILNYSNGYFYGYKNNRIDFSRIRCPNGELIEV